MKKLTSRRVIEYLLLLAFFGGLFVILRPVFERASSISNRASCASHIKQIALACQLYLEDSGEKFPAISSGKNGWADTLHRYAKSWEIFECPSGKQAAEKRRTDYFYNARLVRQKDLDTPAFTIAFGEGPDNGGTNSHFSELPFDWREELNSPVARHYGGANYAFADGHAKWLKPEEVTLDKPGLDHPTFLPK